MFPSCTNITWNMREAELQAELQRHESLEITNECLCSIHHESFEEGFFHITRAFILWMFISTNGSSCTMLRPLENFECANKTEI